MQKTSERGNVVMVLPALPVCHACRQAESPTPHFLGFARTCYINGPVSEKPVAILAHASGYQSMQVQKLICPSCQSIKEAFA